MAQFPAVIQLSDLDGSTGFQITGAAASNYSGIAVSSAGDVNGDGFADLVVGAPGASVNGAYSGATYVIFGKASGFSATLSLAALNGSNGFRITGVAVGDKSGTSVSSGDINRDGFSDLVIAAPSADPNGTSSGTTYVVLGKATSFGSSMLLSDLNGTNGFRISGEAAYDGSGTWVSSVGDINGDGFADVIIGAPGADPNGLSSGASYVVFGKASGFTTNLALSTLNGTNGFQINGEAAQDLSGFAVSFAGDVNGDGFGDLIIGAYGAAASGPYTGASYVVFGKASGFPANFELSALNGGNGFKIVGEAAHDYSGFSVSSAGDVNGDGFADVIIGAYGSPVGGTFAGASYVVFGKASGFSSTLSLSTLNGSNGFRIIGETTYDYSGFSVSSAGDVNGDGFDDLLIGAPFATVNGAHSGTSYVVFGKASGFTADLNLSTLDGTNGFYLDGGSAYDSSGFAVSTAGDVNGDGLADLIIGAPYAGAANLYSGTSYVVFGRLPDASVNRTGTGASQTLVGGNFNDTLSGLAGNDKLFGHGGNDTLNGGAGIDSARFYGARGSYTITRAGAVTVSGPDGTDTLKGVEKAIFDDQTVLLGQGPTRTDLNGDLNADILWQNTNGTVAVWFMNGTNFVGGTAVGTNPGTTWHAIAGADFNGDGKSDILWQNNDGTPVAWFMDGANFLSGGVTGFNPGSSWHVIGAGDFNADGYADILWQNADGTPAVWLMNGLTLVGGAILPNPGTTWHVLGTGDFDGDGKSDIVWQNDNGTAAIWLMNGASFAGGSALGTNPGTTWHFKASGDFNADGKSDILWQNNDGSAAIWFMNGTSLISGAIAGGLNPGSAWQVVGASDFNGDGKADIAWQNTDGTPAIWLMNGASLLGGALLGNPGTTWHMIASSS